MCHTTASPKRTNVVTGAVAIGALQAVARKAAVDQSRKTFDDRSVIKSKTFERSGTHVGNEHIGGCQESEHLGKTGLGVQIDDHRLLAAVIDLERRHASLIRYAQRTENGSLRITGRRLDLDDLGTPIGHQAGRCRPGNPHTKLHNAIANQWSGGTNFGQRVTHQRIAIVAAASLSRMSSAANEPTSASPAATRNVMWNPSSAPLLSTARPSTPSTT